MPVNTYKYLFSEKKLNRKTWHVYLIKQLKTAVQKLLKISLTAS
jgi:hypothetical protein